MKYFTRRGDDGTTGFLGEGRIPKNSLRLETLGSIDEASAALGMARAVSTLPGMKELLLSIQRSLYHAMAEIAASPENVVKFRVINAESVTWLEDQIRLIDQKYPNPREFIVPGDTLDGAVLDQARTIVRRAERNLVDLYSKEKQTDSFLPQYFNRLSSLIFALEIEVYWLTNGGKFTLAKDLESQ